MNKYDSTELPPTVQDITNSRYGRLLVVGYAGNYMGSKRRVRHYWTCACDCGSALDVRSDALTSYAKGEKSCGCYNREQAAERCRSRLVDITGNRYGRLVVTRHIGNIDDNRQHWLCACDCGNETSVRGESLKSGAIKSCGCLSVEVATERMRELSTTHGMSGKPIYNVWLSMKARCENKNNTTYKYYGGRGISVCKKWIDSFESFYEDVGDPPTVNHTLDRVNNNGNYEPKNVRWVTMKEQSRNRRSNFLITHDGKTMTATEWGELLGIRGALIRQRIKRDGWSVKRALTTPAKKLNTTIKVPA